MEFTVPKVPTGTVTFLFSDLVGSTKLWAKDPDAMSASLRIHDQIFTETIAKYHGFVFQPRATPSPPPSEIELVDIAPKPSSRPYNSTGERRPELKVRLGLHIGEADERDGNYFGPVVDQAARIMAVAHGDQCLLTDGVRDASGMRPLTSAPHAARHRCPGPPEPTGDR